MKGRENKKHCVESPTHVGNPISTFISSDVHRYLRFVSGLNTVDIEQDYTPNLWKVEHTTKQADLRVSRLHAASEWLSKEPYKNSTVCFVPRLWLVRNQCLAIYTRLIIRWTAPSIRLHPQTVMKTSAPEEDSVHELFLRLCLGCGDIQKYYGRDSDRIAVSEP